MALAQKEYGFDNGKASGQPYLTPEESLKRLKVPEGWEVKVFAAEPDIINPISFTVDEKGRLWVVECYEYPKRTPKGQKPRDRIKILEDTTGEGRADRVTVWAEGKDFPPGEHENGFDLASGIEVGHGGVFLGAAPYLFFLRDTKGSGHCDSIEVLLKGFGSEDTHEVLNTMQWGPDGLLYGLHGIFTRSKVGEVEMNAAVWRYNVPAKQFDIFAEGTSNPWGLDFDANGQALLACCVIPHCFHMVPGGTYIRQAGSSQNPYAYGLLKEISDHTHHRESGWAHAGTLVLEGDTIPVEYRGSLLMGSIHGCSVKRDLLAKNGSTFVAKHGPDFLVSQDKNFRPINMRWGPDGSIYLIDWHDQNPCHQAPPDSWDMTHGRIYKIQRKGARSEPPPDLGKKTSQELVELLKNDHSPWWYRTALRLLNERRDLSVAPALRELALSTAHPVHALRALWGLYAVGGFDEAFARKTLESADPNMRVWTIRLLGETGKVSDSFLNKLVELAKSDPAPEVRLQLASTAQRLHGQETLPLLHNLMSHKEDARDPCLPLMIWLAYEPRVAVNPKPLEWVKENAAGNPLVTDEIVPRALRRLVATDNPENLAACIAFLGSVKDVGVRKRGLEAMLLALQNRQVDPPAEWMRVLADLRDDQDVEVRRLADRLAVNFHDVEALKRALTAAQDATKPAGERIDAVRSLALVHPADALQPLETLLQQEKNADLQCEVCRALGGYDKPDVARAVLTGWKEYPPAVRIEAVNLLAGRKDWAGELLAAVGANQVPRTDLNDNTILRIRALRDGKLNQQIETVWGRFRDTPAELNQLIDDMRRQLHEGRASAAKGKKVFENNCLKCHKFEGQGHEVGPNLDGAARDIEYLLVNVLDPNRVVGQPYFQRLVELKNGTVKNGLLAAEDKQTITLKTENDVLTVLNRADIEAITVSEKSMMPEGLDKAMSVQDFRDLIRYVMAHPFLTEVAVAGPFPTDKGVTVNLDSPLDTKDLKWDWPVIGPPGRIPLPALKEDTEAVAHVTAEVVAPSAHRTRLHLGAAVALRVWLNGKEVYKGKPGDGQAAPDQASIEVDLREGKNQLLIQATYRGDKVAIYARVLDPQRRLTYPEARQ
jgi:putative membrane-bound dehydrogenase-like protein